MEAFKREMLVHLHSSVYLLDKEGLEDRNSEKDYVRTIIFRYELDLLVWLFKESLSCLISCMF